MQNWKKLGQLFIPDNSSSFLKSHAANPLAILLRKDIYRVFYSGRDILNRSSVGYVDIDIEKKKILNYPQEVLIAFGAEDSFYSHGISIGNLYVMDGNNYILFMGWQYPKNEHWRGDIGRLRLINMDKLVLDPLEPFFFYDKEDNVSLSYPYVLFHDKIFKMWYGSTINWDAGNGEMIHVLKYATSSDGIYWKKHGIVIPYEIGIAQAFSKPSVIIDNTGYNMWFSYRSGSGMTYRIGYAYSSDGSQWQRKDEHVGLKPSPSGWDSEMICYPYVFDHKGKRYMLYNGNGYGKTGFGLAVLENG